MRHCSRSLARGADGMLFIRWSAMWRDVWSEQTISARCCSRSSATDGKKRDHFTVLTNHLHSPTSLKEGDAQNFMFYSDLMGF